MKVPIESSLIKALADHLNAEIVSGTINNIREACAWLSYTFLYIRMCKNPLAYGISMDEVYVDPHLEMKRVELIKEAATTLDICTMIRFDPRSENLACTDMGRIGTLIAQSLFKLIHLHKASCAHEPNHNKLTINLSASHFYLRHGTIEAFNTMLSSHLSESEAYHVMCSSAEFDQLKMRPGI